MSRTIEQVLADEWVSLQQNLSTLDRDRMYRVFSVSGADLPAIANTARAAMIAIRENDDPAAIKRSLAPEFLSHFRAPYSSEERQLISKPSDASLNRNRILKRVVDRCFAFWKSEKTQEEQVATREGMGWTFDNWLYWFEPDQRCWFWHSLCVLEEKIEFTAEIEGWPFASGALRQLFRASGASDVID